MKSKVIIITNNDRQFGEVFQAEPYESVKTICELQHQIFYPKKLIKIGNGYDYQLNNGSIVFSEQIM